MPQPQVIVTGAGGFLGRAVARRLARSGANILSLSRSGAPGCQGVRSYAEAPVGHTLIHLAEEPDRAKANLAGTPYEEAALAVLGALLAKGYRRFIYASSAVLYGDKADTPRKPGDGIYANDTYTSLKSRSESRVLESGKGIVARFANLYGPGMSGNTVLGAILGQLGKAGPMRLRDVTPVRDFLYVEDAADAVARMAGADRTGTFNVGSGEAVRISELAATALSVAGETGRAIEAGAPAREPSRLVLDIQGTREAFAWRPGTTLADGLRNTISRYRESSG